MMNGFEAVKQYQYPDESQALRIKEMTEIAAGAGLSRPERVAQNAELLRAAPDVAPESLELAPVHHHEGLRLARWTLNTYTLRIRDDGTLANESDRADWEISQRDRKLARVMLGKWRSQTAPPMRLSEDDPLSSYLQSLRNVQLLEPHQEVELAQDIEAGLYAVQKLEGGKANKDQKLNLSERRRLSEMAVIGKDAFDHMYEANLPLAVSVAKRYVGLGVPFDDLIQEGNLGLRHAIEKFDYRLGLKFSTYAMNWIEQAMQGALATQARIMSITRQDRNDLVKIISFKKKVALSEGYDPTMEVIAQKTGIDVAKVTALLQNYERYPILLDSPLNHESVNETLMDIIYDADEISIDELIIEKENQSSAAGAMTNAFSNLKTIKRLREKVPMYRILEVRYGMLDGKLKTQEETAKILGLGRKTVHESEKAALELLRNNSKLRQAYLGF